ncbi:MAG: hypothetical protein ABEH81_10975 [Halopenitus sp.]
MAGPDPTELRRVVEAFPARAASSPPDHARAGETSSGSDGIARVDELLDGTYSALRHDWYPELQDLTAAYAAGDRLREDVLEHVESVPSFRLSAGAAPLSDRREALVAAADEDETVAAIADWYARLRSLLDEERADLTTLERLLHDFGYAFAHGLFLGAASPEGVVRRLRLAYRSVGVRIDDTASEAGTERTTFTCPYRSLGAGTCGEKWVCHEKLDRVDDGYVTYLRERGIDYQRPRDCPGSEQCYSTVAWDGADRWWPKTSPAAVAEGP